MSAQTHPREGMMAVVRNRRALITGIQPCDAGKLGRFHLVEVDYTDGQGAESAQLLWEIEPATRLAEPTTPPLLESMKPMEPREFDAMVRAARWSALTPTLAFSGLRRKIEEDLSELEAEVSLRRTHYNRWLSIMREERARVIDQVLPRRYALRGEARVYPIAVEIRLPGGEF